MAHRSASPLSCVCALLLAPACAKDIGEAGWTSASSIGEVGRDDSGDGSDDGTEGDGGSAASDDDSSPAESGASASADDGGSDSGPGDTSDPGLGGDSGPDACGASPDDGPCGCGFREFACEPGFVDPEGTEGPMPPLCGGGSGLGDGAPNVCFGGNFGSGSYSDVDSFCSYIVARWTYLENECGNFGTATLAIDPALMSIAGDEAEAVAGGACPKGPVTCAGSPCGPLDGPAFNIGSGASWLYIDGGDGGALSKDAMFTAPETGMIIQSNAVWADQEGNPIYERACQFNTEFSNAILYHYCNWDGVGVYGDPSTQPTRVGCGVAVDSAGITWRVVKLGA